MATERQTWDRVLDSIPQARPYIEALWEAFDAERPRDSQMIANVSTACVVRARMTGSAIPLVDLGQYLRSWGMPREWCQRFCRRLAVAMDIPVGGKRYV